jgi:hypothetical protein
MPAAITPFRASREGVYVVVEAVLPDQQPRNIGVLLADTGTGRPWFRLRPDFDFAEPEDAEVLELLEEEMRLRASEMGALRYLDWLEDTLSNVVRVTDR